MENMQQCFKSATNHIVKHEDDTAAVGLIRDDNEDAYREGSDGLLLGEETLAALCDGAARERDARPAGSPIWRRARREQFIRKKKKKAGSNAKNFTEGWVEFRDKRVAKLVAASLHNTPIGVRKKSKFHYDLWNIKKGNSFPVISIRCPIITKNKNQMVDEAAGTLQLTPMVEDSAMNSEEEEAEIVSEDKETEQDARLDSSNQNEGKKVVPGIVYLGHIPPRFRPRHVRNLLCVHGEVGRIFLQPEEQFIRKKKKKAGSNAKNFTEGWVEFRDKRVAKLVAASLHNTPIGVRKKSKFHYDLWNIKYLNRFKWTHLSEQLAYERQVQRQRMRAEVSQAKRETNFYLQNVEKSKHFLKDRQKEHAGKSWGFVQRSTEDEIQTSKGKKRLKQQLARSAEIQQKSQSNKSLLTKIFNIQQ